MPRIFSSQKSLKVLLIKSFFIIFFFFFKRTLRRILFCYQKDLKKIKSRVVQSPDFQSPQTIFPIWWCQAGVRNVPTFSSNDVFRYIGQKNFLKFFLRRTKKMTIEKYSKEISLLQKDNMFFSKSWKSFRSLLKTILE